MASGSDRKVLYKGVSRRHYHTDSKPFPAAARLSSRVSGEIKRNSAIEDADDGRSKIGLPVIYGRKGIGVPELLELAGFESVLFKPSLPCSGVSQAGHYGTCSPGLRINS